MKTAVGHRISNCSSEERANALSERVASRRPRRVPWNGGGARLVGASVHARGRWRGASCNFGAGLGRRTVVSGVTSPLSRSQIFVRAARFKLLPELMGPWDGSKHSVSGNDTAGVVLIESGGAERLGRGRLGDYNIK